mgnify:CR=1 FL=1
MIDNNTFHKIPVTFFDGSYNKYQNEVMNLLHFIRTFHPVSIVTVSYTHLTLPTIA